jgi:CHAD domain-containing protein
LFKLSSSHKPPITFCPGEAYAHPLAKLEVSRKEVLVIYGGKTSQMAKLLKKARNDPSVDTVHDLRVAIRRIRVIIRLLPKEKRDSAAVSDYLRAIRALFKATSGVRDADVLLKTYEAHEIPISPGLKSSLSKKRKSGVKAMTLAVKRFDRKAPELGESDLDKNASKRLNKMVDKKEDEVERLHKIVANEEADVLSLHALRVEVKKLRYLIELSEEGRKRGEELSKWQDTLGEIHDIDVAISYAAERTSSPLSAGVVRDLGKKRHELFERFIEDSRKKLG